MPIELVLHVLVWETVPEVVVVDSESIHSGNVFVQAHKPIYWGQHQLTTLVKIELCDFQSSNNHTQYSQLLINH